MILRSKNNRNCTNFTVRIITIKACLLGVYEYGVISLPPTRWKWESKCLFRGDSGCIFVLSKQEQQSRSWKTNPKSEKNQIPKPNPEKPEQIQNDPKNQTRSLNQDQIQRSWSKNQTDIQKRSRPKDQRKITILWNHELQILPVKNWNHRWSNQWKAFSGLNKRSK